MATVLVIEDDPDMREIERAVLRCAGHDVVTANNGMMALRLLESATEERPRLILLDLMMPVMDGFTFLLERSKRALIRNIPVLCITAGGDELLERARKLGATACLKKPADFDDLCDRVAHFVAAHPHDTMADS